eukprot:Gb_38241 [translate_table: standard]
MQWQLSNGQNGGEGDIGKRGRGVRRGVREMKGMTMLLVAVVGVWEMMEKEVEGVGSMSSLAASYGENGPTLCGLKADGSHLVTCFGSDAATVYGAPLRMAFSGVSAGDGFVCGLVMSSRQPYCWGNNIYVQMGVPPAVSANVSYVEVCAGDHHLCALRRRQSDREEASVDCWGYNMTGSYVQGALLSSITAGSLFTCGLFAANNTAICWGDETGSGVISGIPREVRFRVIAAGGYHVCGILLEQGRTLCWGRTDGAAPPRIAFTSLVGGKFHACGLARSNRRAWCWGLTLPNSTPPPFNVQLLALASGDYFTCGISTRGLQALCWGSGYPSNIPVAVAPGVCSTHPCDAGTYEFSPPQVRLCGSSSHVCLPCSQDCPAGMYQSLPCNSKGDRQCSFNCSICSGGQRNKHLSTIQTPIIIGELATAVVAVTILSLVAFVWVRFKLSAGKGNRVESKGKNRSIKKSCFSKELKIVRRAQVFRYEELERATGGFRKESEVGRGSFSCVFKGILGDGRVVAVKRAIVATDVKKDFHTELDLLSRLNHAHLLNLLGYCEEKGERLLVYEFMAHGSLHEHLHGNHKQKLGWIRRVTIAVQAARGLEYLHGYACPPVIHRDIKSSNILIDQEHNARVADFGLSLLGPADSDSPLSELPAGTLGYLDPEYYRLHYLTTKSDVYSFGVLLLEILSGRKAIDMQYEEGNIVEWAVPLIRAGEISSILDPALEPPLNMEALYRIAQIAARCVKMRGKERPSMDKVTTALERALALLMGTPCDDQPILPTEVVLGSSRLHKKSSASEMEFRAPSWITFPSLASSQRRKSSVSEADAAAVQDPKNDETTKPRMEIQLEIGPASPQHDLFLNNNF